MTVDTVSRVSNASQAKQPYLPNNIGGKMTLNNTTVMRGSRDPRLTQVTYTDDLNDLDLSDTAKLLTDSSNDDDQMELDILLDEIVHDVTENEENILIGGFDDTSATEEPDSPISASYEHDVSNGNSTPRSSSDDAPTSPVESLQSRYDEDELAAIPLVALEAARDDYVPPPEAPPPKRRRKPAANAKPKQTRAKRTIKVPNREAPGSVVKVNNKTAVKSTPGSISSRAAPISDVGKSSVTSSSAPAFSPSLMFPTIRQSLLCAPNPIQRIVPLLPVKIDSEQEKKETTDKPRKSAKRKSKSKTNDKPPKAPKLKIPNSKSSKTSSKASNSTSNLWCTELFPNPGEHVTVGRPFVKDSSTPESISRSPVNEAIKLESPALSDSNIRVNDIWCSDLFPRMDEVKTPSPRSDESPTISLSFVLDNSSTSLQSASPEPRVLPVPEKVLLTATQSASESQQQHSEEQQNQLLQQQQLQQQQQLCVTSLSNSITEALARPPISSVNTGVGEIVSLLTAGPMMQKHTSQPVIQSQILSSSAAATTTATTTITTPPAAVASALVPIIGIQSQKPASIPRSPKSSPSPSPPQQPPPPPAPLLAPAVQSLHTSPPPPYHPSPLALEQVPVPSSSSSSPLMLPPPPKYVSSVQGQHLSPLPPQYQLPPPPAPFHLAVKQEKAVKEEEMDDGSSDSDDSSDEYDENGDLRPADDPKRIERRRYNNRVAAQRCRQRKREHFQSLKKEIQEWECQNTRLRYEVHLLQKQLRLMSDMWNEHSAICSHFMGQAPTASTHRHRHSKKRRHRHHKKKRRSRHESAPLTATATQQPVALPIVPPTFLITAQT